MKVLLYWFPSSSFTAIKLSRHSGMVRRNPDCRDANNLCHPWSLGSGDPGRNDEFFLHLMAVKQELGNEQNLSAILVLDNTRRVWNPPLRINIPYLVHNTLII